jgi:hypothetical protein
MSSQLPLVVGVALSVAGYGLVVLAMETQSERIAKPVAAVASASSPARVALADCPKPVTSVDREHSGIAPLSGAGNEATGGKGGAGAGGAAGGAGAAGASAAGGAAGGAGAGGAAGGAGAAGAAPVAASGEISEFRFAAGGILLPKEELTRLVTFAKGVRTKGAAKLLIEGHGDEAGSGEKALGLGRRRATVVRQVLADVGIDPERMTISAADAAGSPSSVAVRVNEVKAP